MAPRRSEWNWPRHPFWHLETVESQQALEQKPRLRHGHRVGALSPSPAIGQHEKVKQSSLRPLGAPVGLGLGGFAASCYSTIQAVMGIFRNPHASSKSHNWRWRRSGFTALASGGAPAQKLTKFRRFAH